MTPAQEARRPSTATIVRATLLAIYTSVVVWLFVGQSTSWPHEGSWASLGFVLFCPGILFQTISLLFTWRTKRKLSGLARVFTIPVGLLLAMALTSWASDRATAGFERAYAPFVSEVEASLADPCRAPARYFALPTVAAYNARTRDEPAATLNHDKKRFLLSFSGGSIDIDGSRIFYDSTVKEWQKFHNDDKTSAQDFTRRTEGLTECILRPQ
jgi:hypothetical protein